MQKIGVKKLVWKNIPLFSYRIVLSVCSPLEQKKNKTKISRHSYRFWFLSENWCCHNVVVAKSGKQKDQSIELDRATIFYNNKNCHNKNVSKIIFRSWAFISYKKIVRLYFITFKNNSSLVSNLDNSPSLFYNFEIK